MYLHFSFQLFLDVFFHVSKFTTCSWRILYWTIFFLPLLRKESLLIFQVTAAGLPSQMELSTDNKKKLQWLIFLVNVKDEQGKQDFRDIGFNSK